MIRASRVLLLTVVWLALWGDLSVANVLSGLVVGVLVVLLFDTGRDGAVVIRPVPAVRFVVRFLLNLVESTFVVARTVITPRERIRTGIVAVPLQGCSEAVATLIADSITLTPGTLTLEVRREPLTLFVHVLDVRQVEKVRAGIRQLEVLAVRAFGSAEAIEQLAVDDTSSWDGR